MKNQILKNSAILFGVGKAPFAPGVWGALAFMPVVLLLTLYTSAEFYMGFAIVFVIYSVYAAGTYIEGAHLKKEIVINKASGILVAFFLFPYNVWVWVIGFLIFTLFSTVKPFPMSHFNRNVKGGFGVVLNDLLAGLFTNVLVHFMILDLLDGKLILWK